MHDYITSLDVQRMYEVPKGYKCIVEECGIHIKFEILIQHLQYSGLCSYVISPERVQGDFLSLEIYRGIP